MKQILSDLTTWKSGTGLLVLECRMANPRGNPDLDNQPSTLYDEIGFITPESLMRHVRDSVMRKMFFREITEDLQEEMNRDKSRSFEIFESRLVDRGKLKEMIKRDTREFLATYWDARVRGAMILEKDGGNGSKKGSFAQTGILSIIPGLSLAPVEIGGTTITNTIGVEEGKKRGMGNMARKWVQHGIYIVPFHVDATRSEITNSTPLDLEIFLRTLPSCYRLTSSSGRTGMFPLQLWYVEHKNLRASCGDQTIFEALTPVKKENPEEPSKSSKEYEFKKDLPEHLKKKVSKVTEVVSLLDED